MTFHRLCWLFVIIFIVILVVCKNTNAQEYKRDFVDGMKVETIKYLSKTYIGDIVYDTLLRDGYELLSIEEGGMFTLSWKAVGDDSITGLAEGFLITERDSTISSVVRYLPNSSNAPYGETITTTVTVPTGKKLLFSVQAVDEANNIGEQSNVVTNQSIYKQIKVDLDTAYFIIKTYPEYTTLPTNLYIINGIGLETGFIDNKNYIVLHISPMRKKDVSMNDYVDLTDLALLIHYLTVPRPAPKPPVTPR